MKTHHRLCPYRPAQHTQCDDFWASRPDAFGTGVSCAVMHYTPEIPCQCDLVLKVEADTVDRAVDAILDEAARCESTGTWMGAGRAMGAVLRCKQAA